MITENTRVSCISIIFATKTIVQTKTTNLKGRNCPHSENYYLSPLLIYRE